MRGRTSCAPPISSNGLSARNAQWRRSEDQWRPKAKRASRQQHNAVITPEVTMCGSNEAIDFWATSLSHATSTGNSLLDFAPWSSQAQPELPTLLLFLESHDGWFLAIIKAFSLVSVSTITSPRISTAWSCRWCEAFVYRLCPQRAAPSKVDPP